MRVDEVETLLGQVVDSFADEGRAGELEEHGDERRDPRDEERLLVRPQIGNTRRIQPLAFFGLIHALGAG